MKNFDLTGEQVRELFDYDPMIGIFTWKKSRGNQFTKPGMKAGSKDTYGHIGIEIKGKTYLAHRLAWLFVYDKWPEHQIDHINRNREDNRIENLRDVIGIENAKNKGNYNNNTTGLKGVTLKKGKFISQITIEGKCKYLGSFKTAEDAHNAYMNAFNERSENENP